MVKLVMAVGVPGSGKSTAVGADMVHISSDKLREELFGDVNDQTHNSHVFNEMARRTIENLKNGNSVYYDATNLSAKKRINFLNQLNGISDLKKICWVFVPPREVCLLQNSSRERKVPEYVIDRMIRNFQPPHESEGWDEIKIFGNTNNHGKLMDLLSSAQAVPHDNPHHTLSVGDHMGAANREYHENFACEYLYVLDQATLFHDIGKPFCKVFFDSRGNETKYAHYYGHECAGAYIYLSYCNLNQYSLEIANLIAHHMDFFKGEAYLNKIANRFGEDFFSKLCIIHKCDVAAH